MLAATAVSGNPYDGPPLADTVAPATLSGHKRGLSPQMKRELKRRSAIEATIGHMKTDGRLDRNFLKGHAGDAINALLAAAGHNVRLILNALAFWLAWILCEARQPEEIAKSDTLLDLHHGKISMP